jgi:DNA replication protein DnaC
MLAGRRSRQLSSAIPPRFAGAAWDRFPLKDLPAATSRPLRAYQRDISAQLDEGRGLLLLGDVGTGKTTAAMVLCRAAMEAGRTVALYRSSRLFAEIRATYADDAKASYLDFFDRLAGVGLLTINDLGAEKQSEWVIQELHALIDERWEHKRPVLVTSNLTLDQIRNQVGSRVVSRLMEMCGDPIMFSGADLRLRDSQFSPEDPGGLRAV